MLLHRADHIDRLHEASDITPGVTLGKLLQRHPVTGAVSGERGAGGRSR